MIKIILFYKFVNLENTEKLKKEHLDFCNNLGVKGRVLLANEGINGSVSGTTDQVEAYKDWISNQEIFRGIEFKEEEGLYHPFEKMVVKVKKEIIRIDCELDLNRVGKHISPQEFLSISSNQDVLILDTRNDYESRAGKFKGAVVPDINSFREFPNFVDKMSVSKDTPILMYCTGGIRCEKASAYMIQKGFTNVSQLHGGIINFCQKLPNTLWEGSCFVFDNRLVSNVGQMENPLSFCIHCNEKCDQYRNCKNKSCNKLAFMCPECRKENHSCCSKDCVKKLLS
ncbi:MAG: rhodanese-related sulfurtransferase [Nanoarchaeota archaeon]